MLHGCVNLLQGAIIIDFKLLVPQLLLLAVATDARVHAGGNLIGADKHQIIPHPSAFTAGHGDGGKGQKETVGAHYLQ